MRVQSVERAATILRRHRREPPAPSWREDAHDFRHDDAEVESDEVDNAEADNVEAGNVEAGNVEAGNADVADADDADRAGSLVDVGRDRDPATGGPSIGGPAGTTDSGVEAAVVGDQPDDAPDSQSRNPL